MFNFAVARMMSIALRSLNLWSGRVWMLWIKSVTCAPHVAQSFEIFEDDIWDVLGVEDNVPEMVAFDALY